MAKNVTRRAAAMCIRKKAILSTILLVVFLSASLMVYLPLADAYRQGPIRVACIGDSITQGTEYPKNLQKLLGTTYNVQNFGLGGSTVLLSSDKPYMQRYAFQNAINFHPHVIILMLGTNDANPRYYWDIDNFIGHYKQLIQALKHETPNIWIVKPPPIFDDGLGPKAENLVNGVLPRIEQVANELNLPIIDVYSAMLPYPDYYWDGVHPDWQGSKVIANEVYHVAFSGTASL